MKKLAKGLTLIIILAAGFYFYTQNLSNSEFVRGAKDNLAAIQGVVKDDKPKNHIEKPDAVKGIYMTSWVAGTKSLRGRVIDLIKDTEINSIVIDIKDDTGMISFEPLNPRLRQIGGFENRIADIHNLIAELHEEGIYVIGRIAVFQDPYLTKVWPEEAVKSASTGGVWKDRKGLSWMDAGSQKVWDYAIDIARDSYDVGFDEINFDYVRFPTDGDIDDMIFPYSQDAEYEDVVESFFSYLHENLKDHEMVRSVDLFGMVTTVENNDLGIGQRLEKALPYFDYVCPMTYPSHYPDNWMGYPDPNLVPGKIMSLAVQGALEKIDKMNTRFVEETITDPETGLDKIVKKEVLAPEEERIAHEKIRPWVQDFDYGGDYGHTEVRAQIDAIEELGLNSWLIWDPNNRYTRSAYNLE